MKGIWGGPANWQTNSAKTVLCSFFYDRLLEVGRIKANSTEEEATPADLKEEAAKACKFTTHAEATAAYPLLGASSKAGKWLCFELTYMHVLLTRGLGFS